MCTAEGLSDVHLKMLVDIPAVIQGRLVLIIVDFIAVLGFLAMMMMIFHILSMALLMLT